MDKPSYQECDTQQFQSHEQIPSAPELTQSMEGGDQQEGTILIRKQAKY
jgi:hypothetical protein